MVKAKGKPYANIILGNPENAAPPKGRLSTTTAEGPHVLNDRGLSLNASDVPSSLSVPTFASVGALRLDAKHLFDYPNGKGLHDR
jgi:hypothetical protein